MFQLSIPSLRLNAFTSKRNHTGTYTQNNFQKTDGNPKKNANFAD